MPLNLKTKNVLFWLLICALPVFTQVKLVPKKVSLKDGREFNLNLPADYEIIPAAENLFYLNT